jgi:diguanylate cyclase (GGDEF)-like protein
VRGIEHEIVRARRTGDRLTLAFVDVDGLKRVNDEHGHAAGDALLRNVVEALGSGLRASDLIVRYGGDEFLCALADAGKHHAAKRLQISEGILARFAIGSLSVGLAELRPGEDAAALIARADHALYSARRQLRETP